MNIKQLLQEIDDLKAKLSRHRPLPPEALKKIEDAIKIEYTYDSNRIEGNTLTLQETTLVINEGITVSGKSMREHLEAINHAEAVDFIKDIASKDIPISETIIKDIHSIVLQQIDKANAGKYRTVPVMISGSKYIPPQPYLIAPQMEQFISSFNKMESDKMHPVMIAAYLHDELVRIHPFIDGNGRTSRLLMNFFLLRHGYPIVSLKSDSASKIKYYNALERSHINNDSDSFKEFVALAVKEALAKYLKVIG